MRGLRRDMMKVFMVRVLLFLGGSPPPIERWKTWALGAHHLVAADGGADPLLAAGFRPVVVGDLDSVQTDLAGLTVHHEPDPDHSDVEKALAYISQTYPGADLVITALEGDRLDHVLASLGACVAYGGPIRLVTGNSVGRVLRAGERQVLPLLPGARISLLPLGMARASMAGVKWPFQSEVLALGGFLSLSNVATEPEVTVEVQAGAALALYETDAVW
jgi:thiamine pyrophosphokinase